MKKHLWCDLKGIPSLIVYVITSLLFVSIALILLFNSAYAQGNLPPGVTPQKIKGVMQKITQTNTDSGVVISTEEAYIDFWNVGELGGDAYKTATVHLTIYYEDEGTSTVTYDLIFSGGPDGIFTIISGPSVTSGSPGYLTQRAIDDYDQVWIPKRMFYEQVECQSNCNLRSGLVDSPWFYFENCDAFSVWFPKCSDCTAEMMWDVNLKAGDVLSPAITFKGPDGQPIKNIGQALYINGQETWSTVWDGKQATLELQYTCPDHIGHVLTMTVPAAGAVQPPVSSSNQNISPVTPAQKTPDSSLKDLLKVILVGSGIISVATTIAVITRKIIKVGAQPKPELKPEPRIDTGSRVEKSKLSAKERTELVNKRALLGSKWHEIRNEITKREKQHLRIIRINTSNRFKAMFIKGLETKDTISGPVGKVVGETIKTATGIDIDKMLFDIDHKRDLDILVKGKECQAAIKQHIQTLKQDLKRTAKEISRLDDQLSLP